MRKQILFILTALLLGLAGLALLMGSLPGPAQAAPVLSHALSEVEGKAEGPPFTPAVLPYTEPQEAGPITLRQAQGGLLRRALGPLSTLSQEQSGQRAQNTALHAADVVAQADGLYTWTQDTRADWEQGTMSWLDSVTVSGSLQLMQRLFGESTTITPRSDLGSGQTEPDIAVDASSNAYAVWVDYRNGNADIYFAYCPAGGSWGASVKVNDDTGTAQQGAPAIAVDSSGNAYAVWGDERNGDGDIYFATRPAAGDWGTNVKVNDDTGTAVQQNPDIAVDSSGNAYAVWEDFRSGNGWDNNIYFAYRSTGGSWGANAQVNDDPGTAGQGGPVIAVDSSGNAYAVWTDSRNGNSDIYFAYRAAISTTWSANVKVNDDAGTAGQHSPAIAVDPSGNASAVWTDPRDEADWQGDIYFANRPAGGSWGANVKVSDDPSTAQQDSPAIAVDSSGNAHAVWSDSRNGDSDIYFANRPAGGSWGANVKVSDDAGIEWQRFPSIAVDPSGNAYAVWHDERNGQPDIYSATRPAGGAWEANVRVDDDTSGTASQSYNFAIAVDASGNAYAVWEDKRNGDEDVYFAYRPASGNWGANVRVNDDVSTEVQAFPDIAVDANGNAYAVWMDLRNGDTHIYFAYRAAISTTWSTNVQVNDGVGSGLWPAIAVDASSNAYAAWADRRNGPFDTYFAYRPVGGNWGANVQVNDGPGDWHPPGPPGIAVDGSGNAYVVWKDERNGDTDIFFAYRAAVSTTWSANVRVNDDSGTAGQHSPAIAVDSSGNAYSVWSDGRNGDKAIYFAYRPAGDTWGANVKVSDDPGTAYHGSPSIAVDPSSNAYAVWNDSRSGNGDIYFAYRPAGGSWGTNVQVNDDVGTAEQRCPDIALDGTGKAYVVWQDDSYGTGHIRFAQSLTTPEYALEGRYTSPKLDTGVTAATWRALAWQGSTPAGTSLAFETRSRIAGGAWSEWVPVNGSIVSPAGQYLQYRVSFSTILTDTTPGLDQVQIGYRAVETPSAPRFATPCGVTNQTTPTLCGSATAGSLVHLYVDGSEVTTVTAGTDGTFTFTPNLSAGSHTLTATAENSSGTGPASTALGLTVDPSLPYDPINVRAGQWSKDGWLMSVPRDGNGCADPTNNWRVWPRADQKFRVEVPVSYTTSAAVTVTVGTATITLTEESTGSFAGVFQPPIQAGDFIIEVNADGETTTVDGGPVLIDPDGVVYEASGTISDTIAGVQVTCYYWDDHSDQWVMWDAWTYSQVNPQTTLEDGYYSFYVPPGTYRVVAEKEGYPAYTSPDLVVVSTPVRHNIPLGWRIYLPVVLRNR